jgi:hypothetical protein
MQPQRYDSVQIGVLIVEGADLVTLGPEILVARKKNEKLPV